MIGSLYSYPHALSATAQIVFKLRDASTFAAATAGDSV